MYNDCHFSVAVSNGPNKEPMKEEFDGYLNQQPQVRDWVRNTTTREQNGHNKYSEMACFVKPILKILKMFY